MIYTLFHTSQHQNQLNHVSCLKILTSIRTKKKQHVNCNSLQDFNFDPLGLSVKCEKYLPWFREALIVVPIVFFSFRIFGVFFFLIVNWSFLWEGNAAI